MQGACGPVELEQVVGLDPGGHEGAAEGDLGADRVVDPAQQHGLVEKRDPGRAQPGQGRARLGGDLAGVVEVGDEPQGLVAGQGTACLSS